MVRVSQCCSEMSKKKSVWAQGENGSKMGAHTNDMIKRGTSVESVTNITTYAKGKTY
jgi:hypothetical protein